MTQFPQLDGFRGAPGLVRLVGHRGARGVMPENTIEGFSFSLQSGVPALEFDVVLTQDNVPVITHNHHLLNAATRGADGKWLAGEELKVAELPLAQLRTYDVGGLDGRTVYGQRFPDQVFLSNIRVPTLSDLLDLTAGPLGKELLFLLEMKSDAAHGDPENAAKKLVRAVVKAVRDRQVEAHTVLHSFDWRLLDLCKQIAPEMPRSYLTQLPENSADLGEDSSKSVAPDFAALEGSIPQAIADRGGHMWCPYYLDVTPELVAEARDLGLVVATWTVNEMADLHRVIEAGVDAIVTDYPGRAQRVLLDRGFAWTANAARA